MSIYRVVEEKKLHEYTENDHAAHQVMEAFKHVDYNNVSKLGIDGYADAVQRACEALFQHTEEEEHDHYIKPSSVLAPGNISPCNRFPESTGCIGDLTTSFNSSRRWIEPDFD
ncbi:hypothetical protein RhiXN_05534 [Rhizoctonia solani]|uniref:Uncharacterized protein n=1 Tax=Rhizoctonia solani TaxID=456999 RepID=A0A8H8NVZ7_9AGAM|nr:uncharacterized protein RhiXN_05534 [Rhizoctonia solani]QRW20545.1 hypothetical protein RhiXN_05534 [Rhizoctonia solani]